MVGIMLNIEEKNLEKVQELLPSLRGLTVSKLVTEGWVAVNTIVEEKVVRDLIPQLKEIGAEGIIEFPLNKVVD